MNQRWSLDALYTSFESEAFKGDLVKCEEELKGFKAWAEDSLVNTEQPVEKMEAHITKLCEFMKTYRRLASYASLTLSVEAKNEKALQMLEKLEAKESELTQPIVMFQKWLRSLGDLEQYITQSKLLEEHRFYLIEMASKNKYLLSDREEVLIAKMKNTGSKAWNKLHDMLTSTVLVDINIKGEAKKLPLPVVRNMAYDGDAELRRTAYEAELASYKKIDESSAACLNGIKGEFITLSKMKGYTSSLEKTLIDSRMDEETLDAMLTAIKESLPSFHKYYRKKGELLGHQNGLPFYDLFAPVGDAEMTFTYEEAREFIVKNFRTFSDKLADFADNAFEKQWIDAEPREGKRGGAFCSNLNFIKESRILTNFTGSFSNVSTLAHELGHGYHGSCLTEESLLNTAYPMPIAETASIFCETIVKNAALKTATEEEAFVILENSLMGEGQVIVDIYSRYLFESEVFARREEGSLSVNELKEIMKQAQKDAYGDGLNHEYLHEYMWVNKPHYYFPERNFYNFPYAFGLLFGKGLYAEYLKRGEVFIEQYDQLLSVTGKNSIADVAAIMGIDVRSIDFWRSSLKIIAEEIEKFISLK